MKRELTNVNFDEISILSGNYIEYRVEIYLFYSPIVVVLGVSFLNVG